MDYQKIVVELRESADFIDRTLGHNRYVTLYNNAASTIESLAEQVLSNQRAIERMGKFGHLFIDYQGCPKGPTGRMCVPIEAEVLGMPAIKDGDGQQWRPVNEDALQDLLKDYLLLKSKKV